MQVLANKISQNSYLFREKVKRLLLIVPLFLFHIILYNFVGMCENESNYSFLLDIDHIIPFVPGMVWIYISTYIVIPLVGFLIKDTKDFYRLAVTIVISWLITYPFFYFFPATYPRPDFALVDLSTWMLKLNYIHDVANNTFPSLHVSLSFVIAFTMVHISKKKNILWIIWAMLISLSTVMVKKHFIVDTFGGLIVAQIAFLLVFKLKIADNAIEDFESKLKKIKLDW